MVVKKRILLWDWTNSAGPGSQTGQEDMNKVPFGGNSPISSVCNWNAWAPPELKGRAPFRPMIHGVSNLSGNDWDSIEATHESIILYFNEPERAGISPEQAKDIWYKQILPLKHKGKKLGSPAVASDEQGKNWLNRWMELVEKDPPDFLCLHCYSESSDTTIQYFKDMHAKYPAHPVMVTEFASIDRNYQSVLKFTISVVNWMDKTEWIHEYGLFDFQKKLADDFVSPAAQLMDSKGGFTELGKMYLHDQPMEHPK